MADQITFNTGNDAEAPEDHDAKMAEVFEKSGQAPSEELQTETPSGERPDWLPENFKSVEDFRASYEEQQKTLTKAQQELAELRKGGESEQPEADDKKAKEEKGEEKPSNRSLSEADLVDYTNELAENGDLSEESRAKLIEQFDVPDFVMDTYIEGVKAITERQNAAIDNAFGGEEAKEAMLAWAGQNLSETEQNTLDKQFASGDMNSVLFAIDALKTKYEAAEGKAPSTRLTGKGEAASSASFQSWAEVSTAMDDPRYHDDPAYRASVIEKMRGFNG